jgi:hypothetical protein
MQLEQTPEELNRLGDFSLLRSSIAFFCWTRCAGNVIVKSYAFARRMWDSGYAMASGFHSQIEKDYLDILLTGAGPVIACPARRLSISRLPREWHTAIEERRMLLLSRFAEKQSRATADLAAERNRFVARITDEVLMAYAHPSGKIEALCGEVLASGKRVYTFNDPASRHLIEIGAGPIEPDHFSPQQVAREGVHA